MRELRYRILNVFTVGGDRLSGNPLCVFEDGSGLDDATMQALARQLNLSETTFVLPPTEPRATARVRIFAATFEMPFAGHPTLGTAQVVRDLTGAGDRVTLEMIAGLVEVKADGDDWTLRTARPAETREPEASRAELARMLGVSVLAIAAAPLWVDTGSEQLIVPLATVDDVERARPSADLLGRHAFSPQRGSSMAYVWALGGEGQVVARFFFLEHGTVVEDPATGSACANLGGYLSATRDARDVLLVIRQGAQVGRPSLLRLFIDAAGQIFVRGAVIELGRGVFSL